MINILFSGNSGVFDGVLTCGLSILKRCAPETSFCFYLLTMDVSHLKETYTPISQKQADFFEEVVKEYNGENRVVLLDITELYNRNLREAPTRVRIARRTRFCAFSPTRSTFFPTNCSISTSILCSTKT